MVCRGRYQEFSNALEDPVLYQERSLKRILSKATKTEYGKQFQLAKSDGIEEFQSKLPIVEYADIEAQINAQARHDLQQLCPGTIRYFEKTSGSSGKKKLIPYNKAILDDFGALFKIWVFDVLKFGPKLEKAKIWYSVSPQLAHTDEEVSSLSLGLEDDSQYLSGFLRPLIKTFLAVDPRIQRVTDPHDYFLILACSLICCENLEIISIWNPSFFLEVMRFAEKNREAVLNTLKKGSCRWRDLEFAVENKRQHKLFSAEASWSKIWPHLKIISCWDSASAGMSASPLKEIFPHTLVQGKGLLATEAGMTIPITKAEGALPFLTGCFFEFESEGDQTIHLVNELKEGETYQIIFSQSAGLLRYRTMDRVRVSHYYKKTPVLDFIGRAGDLCDLVGEKLHVDNVKKALTDLGYHDDFIVVPSFAGGKASYLTLVASSDINLDNLDEKLQSLHHYRLARRLGQLASMTTRKEKRLREKYIDFCVEYKKTKRGDIKSSQIIKKVDEADGFLLFLKEEN